MNQTNQTNAPESAANKPAVWANPTPAGLVALAVAAFCFFALLTGLVGHGALPLLACFLLAGFVIQLTVALLDLKANNTAGGNTFLYFSAFFMLASGLEMLLKYFVPGLDTRVDGWAWMALFLVVVLWTPAFYKSPAVLFLLVLILDVAVLFIMLNDLKIPAFACAATVFSTISGVCMLLCGILAVYLSAAMVLNTTYGRTILPNPSFYKKK
ncbi:MAG: GPR1/FUN34/YaaH family transporter [Firmicutes bacterium]|nr:GPR1/FUN34/YaaH family transporter [Bacillota bacterium]